MVRGALNSVATRDVPLAKKVDMKCMPVNVLKNIARMTRTLCVLIMSHTHFSSESTLCSCVNVKELLARDKRGI